jgi:hypothetical protein
MKRAGYDASSLNFKNENIESVIGSLTNAATFNVDLKQRNAWQYIIQHLKNAISEFDNAYIFLEFAIPRMGRRVDAIILFNGCVFAIEYKVGSSEFYSADIDQVLGYALDLKNFHEPSHQLPIIPILISTKTEPQSYDSKLSDDQICEPILSNGDNLADIIKVVSKQFGKTAIKASEWLNGRYKPTPTIIEAAQALYWNHRVDEITRNEAGAENLSATAAYVSSVIGSAKKHHKKAICFITGVPGSGKTLAGLNIANIRTKASEDEHAVFLSGNGPLVKVLREALTRDQRERTEFDDSDQKPLKPVTQFIQNIHHFRDDNLQSESAPDEKVVIFDEAQRAWNKKQQSKFMQQDRAVPNFDKSEPEFLLSVMDRHQDWCTVVCLVGSGQEINTGEAGLGEWLIALKNHFPNWEIHLSNRIIEQPIEFRVTELPSGLITDNALHLATCIRAFRSETVSSFASAIIDNKPDEAKSLSQSLSKYDFKLTRDLSAAREWLRKKRRGTERAGLLAFSNAIRLKPEGLYVKARIEPEDWFLAKRTDVRSSDYLEDVATEFDVQGLELDWTCICIDANLRLDEKSITPMLFKGTRWQSVNDLDRRQYVLNAHRVLLTRARQGVIVFIPRGDTRDQTRNPRWYNSLYDYFIRCGVTPL